LLWLGLGTLVGACGLIPEEETRERATSQRLGEVSPSSGPLLGRIVVNHDEWTFTNTGFSRTGNAAVFARNVAHWFTGGRPGRFLAYSTNFGLRESTLAATLTSAGHSWSVSTSVPFTLSTLREYDAVFIGGDVADTSVLTQYVREGGNVYLMAGTGWGGAASEAARWNPFLEAFGLRFGSVYNGIGGVVGGTSTHPVLSGVPSLFYDNGNTIQRLNSADPHTAIIHAVSNQGLLAVYDGCPGAADCRQPPPACLEIRLSGYNLFLLEDYTQGHDVQGKVAAGGNIALTDFAVGAGVPDGDTAQVLVAGGNLSVSRGGVWGDAWYGGSYTTDPSVVFPRGTASQGRPIDFAARFTELRNLSARLGSLPANGTTTRESWGGVMLQGTDPDVNVFQVNASAFTGATLLSINAPAGSLAVINISGSQATFTGFGHSFSGGIDQHGVLFNFVDATAITAHGFGFWGTVLAPYAHVNFSNGSWDGGIYARSLTGNAEGHINPLTDRDICPSGAPINACSPHDATTDRSIPTPVTAAACEETYLSDLCPAWEHNVNGCVTFDTVYWQPDIVVDGVRYEKGISMHAPNPGASPLSTCRFHDQGQPYHSGRGRTAWDLGGRFDRFSATIALAEAWGNDPHRGSVVFRVYVDDVLRYESPVVTAPTLPLNLAIDTTNAQTLVLETDSQGGYLDDDAVWLNARLRRTCP
jgi:choice-of-anchor A domain-containing protein